MPYSPPYGYICGCYYLRPPVSKWSHPQKTYLAQVSTKVHTTILATTLRTTLTQTFVNPSEHKAIKELSYSFPLYDGVSVVGFKCTIGSKVIEGEVKEKEKARAVYQEAKDRGEVAGLLEQLPEASDVFITKLGNVPPASSVVVEITYLGELKHDAEVDGVRFTIPSYVAPRYGEYPSELASESIAKCRAQKGFEAVIDAELGDGAYIREMRSPSHPIAVSLGTTSLAPHADPTPNKASATLSLGTAELSKDFVLQIVAKETAIPKAVLETHPTIPGQRALMTTLVPKFNLPPERPEIVFICDRSGSMMGTKIAALRNALKVFLKSLPLGTKFNICSFGSSYSFLWPKSESYSQKSLDTAMKHLESGFDANFGGTEMYRPLEETIKRRYGDMNLEIFLVTDGEIWDQQRLFDLLNREIGEKKAPIRVFTLGVGDAFSSSLIEGVARAGSGFSQAVGEDEKLDGKVVRMLKAALSPHVDDYTLEVRYADGKVDQVRENFVVDVEESKGEKAPSLGEKIAKKAISLFDRSADPDATEAPVKDEDGQGRYAHLPTIETPKLLQAPHKIPPLFPFSRTTVYLLVSPLAEQYQPTAVVLKATSKHGPLELEIPVQVLDQPGETIHQLAAKKAVHELEEGRGWLASATDAASGESLKEKHEGRFSEFVEREAVRLGVQFQVGGKFCSFVAVEKKARDKDQMEEEWEFLDDEVDKMTLAEGGGPEGFGAYGSADASVRRKGGSPGRGGVAAFARSTRSRMAAQPMMMMQQSLPQSATTSFGPPGPQYAPPQAGYGSALQSISFGGPAGGMAPPMASASPWAGQSQAFGASAPAPASSYNPFYSMGGHNPTDIHRSSITSGPPPPPAPRKAAFGGGSRGGYGGGFTPQSLSYDVTPMSAAGSRSDEAELSDEDMETEVFVERRESATKGPSDKSKKKKQASGGGLASALMQRKAGPANPKSADPLQALIELQTFEGFWELSAELCIAIGVQKTQVEKLAKDKGYSPKVLATALAVQYFTTSLTDQEESWELVVEKAKAWLAGEGHDDGSELWKAAAALVQDEDW